MLQLYGTRQSRAFRCLWMLEEAAGDSGLEYEVVPTDFHAGDTKTAEYLAINPNGRVPTLVDGDLVLVESLAINYYIAKRYAPQFWPEGRHAEPRALMWMAWALCELEGPHDAANLAQNEIDAERLQQVLVMLERTLDTRSYMMGERFTVVDLNTAAMLLRPQYRPIARSNQIVGTWLSICMDRPALERALDT